MPSYITKADCPVALGMMYAQLIAEKNANIKSEWEIEQKRHSVWWPVYAGTAEFDYQTGVIDHHDWRPY